MKKVYSIMGVCALMALATSCGGNKNANDSDSIVAESAAAIEITDSVTPNGDTLIEVEAMEEKAEAVVNDAPAAKKATQKAATSAVKKVEDKATQVAKEASAETKAAASAAMQRTKQAAKEGATDAKEKASQWAGKQNF